MHRFVLSSLLLVVATACPADPEPGETQAASSSGPAPLTDSTLGPGDSDNCGTGDCCAINPNFCEPTGATSLPPTDDTTESTSSSSGTDTGTDTATDTDTGSVTPCGFEDTLCMLATGKTDPVDCGIVTLDDDAAAWQAASECAASRAAMQSAFKVAFQQPSDDSLIFDGYYGVVGIVYGLGRIYTDTFGDPMLGSYSCTDVVPSPDCVPDPAVGRHCLECLDEGEVNPLECVM